MSEFYLGKFTCGPGRHWVHSDAPAKRTKQPVAKPPPRRCPQCGAEMQSTVPCQPCEALRLVAVEVLEQCQDNECGNYIGQGGKPKCRLLAPNPCQLSFKIMGGWRCPDGFHEGIE